MQVTWCVLLVACLLRVPAGTSLRHTIHQVCPRFTQTAIDASHGRRPTCDPYIITAATTDRRSPATEAPFAFEPSSKVLKLMCMLPVRRPLAVAGITRIAY